MLEKREWCYLQPPKAFEIAQCDCGDDDAHWSEFKGHLWCAKCQKDFIPAHGGVFDGPIQVGVAAMLGISFDRYIITTGKVERFDPEAANWVEHSESRPPSK